MKKVEWIVFRIFQAYVSGSWICSILLKFAPKVILVIGRCMLLSIFNKQILFWNTEFAIFMDWISGKWILKLQETGWDTHTVPGLSFFYSINRKHIIECMISGQMISVISDKVLQWNLSKADNMGANICVCFRQVSTLARLALNSFYCTAYTPVKLFWPPPPPSPRGSLVSK